MKSIANTSALFFLAVIVSIIILVPLMFIWTLNTLFAIGIPVSFKTWLAAFLLLLLIRLIFKGIDFSPPFQESPDEEDGYEEDEADEEEEEDAGDERPLILKLIVFVRRGPMPRQKDVYVNRIIDSIVEDLDETTLSKETVIHLTTSRRPFNKGQIDSIIANAVAANDLSPFELRKFGPMRYKTIKDSEGYRVTVILVEGR